MEDGQTTQWPKEKGHKENNDIQTHKTKDLVIRTPLKPRVNSGAQESKQSESTISRPYWQ